MSDISELEIELPPLPVQQKYVDVYRSMLTNQQCYERGLEDLRIVCEGYMDNLRNQMPHHAMVITLSYARAEMKNCSMG